MLFRCILPEWRKIEDPSLPKVVEGEFSPSEIIGLNYQCYNIFYLPNYPSKFIPGDKPSDGKDIDTFEFVFVDCDLKDRVYASKEQFIEALLNFAVAPYSIIDSGNGIHAYWKLTDLDQMSYLRLQRRLMRFFKTDEAVGKLHQLMRYPGTVNTKDPNNLKLCEVIDSHDIEYTCEHLDKALPPIRQDDEKYCQDHYNKVFGIVDEKALANDKLPQKFMQLLGENHEVKNLYAGNVSDRSVSDYRLGHILFAHGFTKEEARSVLINVAKAVDRSPAHRLSYAESIIDKIWTHETLQSPPESLGKSVAEIISRGENTINGTSFRCHPLIDNTHHGFKLSQVIGLVAGSGVGKTALALNMFKWFVENNPDYVHFFISLEQPGHEIASRWKTMCGDDTRLHNKVYVIDNYDEKGTFRDLSLPIIQEYLLKFQATTGRKIGCVVVDHIGALKQVNKREEREGISAICKEMKSFAITTNTLLIMQSQTNREKAGIGDLELNKDAAYGSVSFECWCDYLITMWQPLKRCYAEPLCPTTMAIKFCKIRHKKIGWDKRQEDVPYTLYFDPGSETIREMTQAEETAFTYFNNKATTIRKQDRKTDLVIYTRLSEELTYEPANKDSKDPA